MRESGWKSPGRKIYIHTRLALTQIDKCLLIYRRSTHREKLRERAINTLRESKRAKDVNAASSCFASYSLFIFRDILIYSAESILKSMQASTRSRLTENELNELNLKY